jgi:TATA-box binding protein (TBP) (component of TFIID and TFIIIB)
MAAVDAGNAAVLAEFLADPDADPNIKIGTTDTLLNRAVYKGNKTIVEMLLADPRTDPNVKLSDRSAIHSAFIHKKYDIAKLIIADPRTDLSLDIGSTTPLQYAASAGRVDIVRMMLDDPRITASDINNKKRPPIVAGFWHPEVVKLFLSDPRTDVNLKDQFGKPVFYNAISISYYNPGAAIPTIKVLMADPRVDINMPGLVSTMAGDELTITPINEAVSNVSYDPEKYPSFLEIIKILLSDPRLVVDDATKALIRDPRISKDVRDIFRNHMKPLAEVNIPAGTENAISFEAIQNGNVIVDFHGERNLGRYYKADTYNSITEPKKNPFTREPIRAENTVRYKAKIVGGRRTRSGNRKIRRRRSRSRM